MSSVLRKAIWGIYGNVKSNSYIEWNKHNSNMVISDKLIDSRYTIAVSAKISYYGIVDNEIQWKHKQDFEVSLPFVIGLTKEDFYEDCTRAIAEQCALEAPLWGASTMKYDSRYFNLYEPTEDDIPPYSDEDLTEISEIKITLVHNKKKNLLDLTWEEDEKSKDSYSETDSKIILVHKDILELISKD